MMAPLETVRRRALLTQRELANKAGVTQSTVYLIETGKQPRPSLRVKRSISEALGVAPTDIDEFRASVEAEMAINAPYFPGIKFATLFWLNEATKRWPDRITQAVFH